MLGLPKVADGAVDEPSFAPAPWPQLLLLFVEVLSMIGGGFLLVLASPDLSVIQIFTRAAAVGLGLVAFDMLLGAVGLQAWRSVGPRYLERARELVAEQPP